jgi:hypothetical protein
MARTLSQLEALIMEETDAMRLIGTTRAASAVIEGREKRRDDNGGFIVPPPCPVERFARARMEEFSHDPATRRVSTSEPRPRHKTASELRAMPHEDALLYQIENPMTDLEKEQALENEQAMAEYEQDGEIPVNSALWDDGPPDL